MARIVYTLGILKGSIGGVTFQDNTSGHIVRARPRPAKSSTRKQMLNHSVHQDLLQGWSLLSLSDKTEWNVFASAHTKTDKYGQEKTLTGANWYASLNYMKTILNDTLLVTPPTYLLPTGAPSFEIIPTDTRLYIHVSGSINYDKMALIVWSTPPTRTVSGYANRIRKFTALYKSDDGATLDLTEAWQDTHGIQWSPLTSFPSANIIICLEVVRKQTGITSSMLCSTATVSNLESELESIYYYA